MQIADAERRRFLRMVGNVEALRPTERVMHMQVAGNRRHGAKLLAEIETAIGGFDIGMAEIDQRHQMFMADRLHGCGDFGRGLAILAGFGGEDVFKGDAHAMRSGEFGEFKQCLALALVGLGPVENLAWAKFAAMLDKNAGAQPVADFDQRLGRLKLETAGGRVHEVGRNEAVHSVTEIELLRERHEAIGAVLNDTATGNEIEAGYAQFDRIAADVCQRTQIAFQRMKFTVVRTNVKPCSDKIAHNVLQILQ